MIIEHANPYIGLNGEQQASIHPSLGLAEVVNARRIDVGSTVAVHIHAYFDDAGKLD